MSVGLEEVKKDVTQLTRSIGRKIKDKYMYEEIEVKVRSATSNDPWGASSTLMQEIAEATYDYMQYPKMMSMLWKRLTDIHQIKHVQKALILVEYLLRNGKDTFVVDCKERIRDISKLQKFTYLKDGVDIAKDIRTKSQVVYGLLMDSKKLAKERDVAAKTKGKYTGFSNRESSFIMSQHQRQQEYDSFSKSKKEDDSDDDIPQKRTPVKKIEKRSQDNSAPWEDVSGSDDDDNEFNGLSNDPPKQKENQRNEPLQDDLFGFNDTQTQTPPKQRVIPPTQASPFSGGGGLQDIDSLFTQATVQQPITTPNNRRESIDFLSDNAPVQSSANSNEVDPFASLSTPSNEPFGATTVQPLTQDVGQWSPFDQGNQQPLTQVQAPTATAQVQETKANILDVGLNIFSNTQVNTQSAKKGPTMKELAQGNPMGSSLLPNFGFNSPKSQMPTQQQQPVLDQYGLPVQTNRNVPTTQGNFVDPFAAFGTFK